MTHNEREVLRRLQSGNEKTWVQFANRLMPVITRRVNDALNYKARQVTAENVANEIQLSLIVTIGKINLDDDPAGTPND